MKGGYKYMGNVKIDKSTQVFLVLGMIVMLAFSGFTAFKPVTVNVAEADVDEEAIAQLVIGSIVLPSDNASKTNDKLDAIYEEMFKDDEAEKFAEDLALDELDSKDFKKELVKFLLNDSKIDGVISEIDYRDIEDINVRDIDISLEAVNKAEVETKMKKKRHELVLFSTSRI